ncbi:helix-turn-helix transcriptional regulator [Pseudonocardia sp. NPDC049635]|uniref:helix-turn-helix domain-containing protein n=1 Tax=Pseudonocardia sp. NPDC049635 TaxID=3155506 RepID=UPI0033CC6FAF
MPPTIAQQVGLAVRIVLMEQGRQQSEIAEALNLTDAAVSRRCHGSTAFRADELLTISQLLGVPVQRFYERALADRPAPTPAA